jgi:hypothetical protein
MKNKSRKIIISSLFLIGLLLSASNSIAVPKIGNIQLAPLTPKPLDEVTFTADIVEYPDYAKAVYLVLNEYKDDSLYTDGFNESMDDKGDGAYEIKIQLKYDDATKIKYHFVINVQNYPGVEWTESETTQVDLDTSMTRAYDGETDNNNDGSDGTSGTPGFELVFLIIAIGIILYFKRKKNHFN